MGYLNMSLGYIKGENMIILDEGDYRFHASIGTINIFTDTEREIRTQRVLLTNIHNTENTVTVDKDWFYNKRMINLAKKNFNKTVSFSSHCKRVIVKKSNGKLKLYAIWTEVKDVELGDE